MTESFNTSENYTAREKIKYVFENILPSEKNGETNEPFILFSSAAASLYNNNSDASDIDIMTTREGIYHLLKKL